MKYILKLPTPLLLNFFAAFTLSLISFSYAMPVEIIIGILTLKLVLLRGILVNNPEEILINLTPIFFNLSKLLKSPGVEKKTSPNFSVISFNLYNSSSLNSLFQKLFIRWCIF